MAGQKEDRTLHRDHPGVLSDTDSWAKAETAVYVVNTGDTLLRERRLDEKSQVQDEIVVRIADQADHAPPAPPAGDLLYSIEETPPWYLCILLGFQHYLTMFGGSVAIPLVTAPALCMGDDQVAKSELLGSIFFVSGIVTILQSTFGCRLPIVQGGTFAFLVPLFAIMSLPQWQCPIPTDVNSTNLFNETSMMAEESDPVWHTRMREIQGAIAVASIFEVFVGFSGILGLLLQYIGPLAIAPTISLIGISLFQAAADFSSGQWWIAILTMALVTLFSQYLRNIDVPCFTYNKKKGCHRAGYPIFKLFPVIFAILVVWSICHILTVADVFPADPKGWGHAARTDSKSSVLRDAKWFRVPYPGQWGLPTVSIAGVFGMLAGVLAGIVESVGDYYAAARLSGAPPPPVHAINRGMIAAVGISNLQFVDLNSSRNLFIFGFSLFFGLSAPHWVTNHPGAVNTGVTILDQLLTVLFSTSMFVGGGLGFFLDNTIPGTDEERGMVHWRSHLLKTHSSSQTANEHSTCYDMPFGMNLIRKSACARNLPISPTFTGCCRTTAQSNDFPTTDNDTIDDVQLSSL